MNDHRTPQVIFIDWYKTLSTSLFWVDHPGVLLSPQELNSINSFVFNQPGLVELWMKGFTNAETAAAEAAHHLRLGASDVLAELEYSCEAMELYDPTVVDFIQALQQQGTTVILATDNMDTFERWTVPALHLDTIFDGIITSVFRGALKAEIVDGYSPFFGHYLSQNGIQATETLLIDDSSLEQMAALLGMQFRRLEHPEQLAVILNGFLV